jgi:hypothetical protein
MCVFLRECPCLSGFYGNVRFEKVAEMLGLYRWDPSSDSLHSISGVPERFPAERPQEPFGSAVKVAVRLGFHRCGRGSH